MVEDDIVARLQRENAELRERLARVEEQAARYDVLCSIMSEGVMVLDRNGRYVAIEPTLAFPPEVRPRVLGSHLGDMFSPELTERMLTGIRRSLATGETGTIEFALPLPGNERWTSAVFKPLTADAVLWYSNDVTTERQLRLAEQGLRTFEAVVERTPDGVALVAADGRFLYANAAYRGLTGAAEAGAPATLFAAHVGDPGQVRAALTEAHEQGHWTGQLDVGVDDRARVPCQVSLVRLPAAPGCTPDLAVIARDLRPFLDAERQRVALQEQVIAAQSAALRELSTPLLPLAEGVICMPLIGTIDERRAQEIMERLLTGIVQQRAHTAILDVTGVRVPDARVADALLQVARAAKLLGARVLLTGIGPEVAQTLVELQTELRGITTLGDLQSGIAHALRSGRSRG